MKHTMKNAMNNRFDGKLAQPGRTDIQAVLRMTLRRFILALILSLTSMVACADFSSATQAYRQHHYAEAYKDFMHLAKTGDARAQTIIALMNKFGESVPKSATAAFSWYLKAAKQHYGPAMFQVGLMYAHGTGVKADRDSAVRWLKRAAQSGFKRAKGALAQLGVEPASLAGKDKNNEESLAWNLRLPNPIRDARTPMAHLSPNASYRVLLGIFDTRADASRLSDALIERAPDIFKYAAPIVGLDPDKEQRSYRVQAGPFVGLSAAVGFCKRLQADIRTFCQPVTL